MTNHPHDRPRRYNHGTGATRFGDLIAGQPLDYGKNAPRREVTVAGVTSVLPAALADQLERTYGAWAKANPQEAAKPPRRRPRRTTPNLEALEEREIEARAQARLDRLVRLESEMAEQFRAARFADADPDVRGAAKAWLNNPTRRNLLLVGAVGTGKTWTAHAVVRDLVERSGDNWPLIVTAPNLFRALRPGGPEDFYDEVCEVPLLLLDDLGAEKPSEWTGEQLTSIIDTRWANHRPIIATSNLNLPALSEAIGERAYSRLAKAGTTIVGFDGPDRRKEVASDD